MDYTGDAFEDIIHTYTAEGIYYPTLTVTDSQGNIYADTIAITVLDKTKMNAMLQKKWGGVKTAVASGDIDSAMSHFSLNSKEVYREQFTALAPVVTDIINELNTAQTHMVTIEGNTAQYELIVTRAGRTYSFQLQFIKDNNGLWKIWRF